MLLPPSSSSRPHYSGPQILAPGEATRAGIPLSAWREYGYWARPVIGGVEVRNSDSTLCSRAFHSTRQRGLTVRCKLIHRPSAGPRATGSRRRCSVQELERRRRLTTSRELGTRAYSPFAAAEASVLENARDQRDIPGALGMPAQSVFRAHPCRLTDTLLRYQARRRIDNFRNRRRSPRAGFELEPVSACDVSFRYRGQILMFRGDFLSTQRMRRYSSQRLLTTRFQYSPGRS